MRRRRLKPYGEVLDELPAWEREWEDTWRGQLRSIQRLSWFAVVVFIIAIVEMVIKTWYMTAFDLTFALVIVIISVRTTRREMHKWSDGRKR